MSGAAQAHRTGRANAGRRPGVSNGRGDIVIGADLVESALRAAAAHLGVAIGALYAREGRRCRVLAAASIRARTGCVAAPITEAADLAASEIAPTQLLKFKIETDDLMEVVEALERAGAFDDLARGGSASGAEMRARFGVKPAVRDPERSQQISRAMRESAQGRKHKRESARANSDGPRPAGNGSSVPTTAPTRADVAAMLASPKVGRAFRSSRPSAPQRDASAPLPAVAPARRVVRPVTPLVVRFAGWFMAADWGLEASATLFDVDAEALGMALDGGVPEGRGAA